MAAERSGGLLRSLGCTLKAKMEMMKMMVKMMKLVMVMVEL